MRLDKFLKVSRLIKRRTIAKEIIDEDVVLVNEKVAKPSKEIHVGDEITLFLGKRKLVVRVLSMPNTISKEKTSEMYEVVSSSVINPSEHS